MLISTIRIQNFRSIRDESFDCRDLTVLVGPNGSGKSTVLGAIDLFYKDSVHVTKDDFFNRNIDTDIIISITFRDLIDPAKNLFHRYIAPDDSLTIEKVISWDEGSRNNCKFSFHGAIPRNADFSAIIANFNQGDRGATSRELLKKLIESGKYEDLPGWTTISGTRDALSEWEANHPDQCELSRDDGQFFGFREVAQGYLGQFTKCLYIPAVRDAKQDAEEGKDSIFSELLDLVVRNTLANRPEFKDLQEEFQTKFEALISPESIPEIHDLGTRLSATIKTYVPTAEIQLDWLPCSDINLPNPRAMITLFEDGYNSPVDKCGHGLQRAFIFTMLQHLVVAQIPTPTDPDDSASNAEGETEQNSVHLPSLILIIEEPELYQHPNRQRHFARILSELAAGTAPGVADQTQVIYTSHSPYFVGIDRVNEIRVLQKQQIQDGLPKETKVVQTSLDQVAHQLWCFDGEQGPEYSAATLKARLTSIMTPRINEGFFAKLAVLVEGEDDYAAITGMAQAMGIELESLGVSIIPCGGKNNLDRPATIFKELGIDTYLVWDGDYGDKKANPEDNHCLLRLVGSNPEDWPEGVFDEFAVFKSILEDSMKNDIGEDAYETYLNICKEKYSFNKHKHAKKNPNVVRDLILMAQENGQEFSTLRTIVGKIMAIINKRKEQEEIV